MSMLWVCPAEVYCIRVTFFSNTSIPGDAEGETQRFGKCRKRIFIYLFFSILLFCYSPVAVLLAVKPARLQPRDSLALPRP